jgi:hypothetical protein
MTKRYRYPKGHPKAGQFQKAKEGAKNFVRKNFDRISKGDLEIKKLTPQEKRIYAGLKGSDFGNRFTYGKQKFYDPTGQLKNIILPATGGNRDLTNFYTKDQIVPFLNLNLQFASDEQRQTFIKGELQNLQRYQKKNGALLDIVKLVEKYSKKGYNLNVIDQDGESNPNVFGVQALQNFEMDMIQNAGRKAKRSQGTKNPFIRLQINYEPIINVLNKTITIDLRDINTDLSDEENTDVVDLSNS